MVNHYKWNRKTKNQAGKKDTGNSTKKLGKGAGRVLYTHTGWRNNERQVGPMRGGTCGLKTQDKTGVWNHRGGKRTKTVSKNLKNATRKLQKSQNKARKQTG